jgi:hypothetical protein
MEESSQRGMLYGGKFTLRLVVIIIGNMYNLSYQIKQRLILQLRQSK